jgi:hypothetical protein
LLADLLDFHDFGDPELVAEALDEGAGVEGAADPEADAFDEAEDE